MFNFLFYGITAMVGYLMPMPYLIWFGFFGILVRLFNQIKQQNKKFNFLYLMI